MNDEQYLKVSKRTADHNHKAILTRIATHENIELFHAGIGLATESGEFLDALKKCFFYGVELDTVNLKEELGDLLWYVALAMRALETTFDEEFQRNIDKLMARYPNRFTEEDAVSRNLNKERKILENK